MWPNRARRATVPQCIPQAPRAGLMNLPRTVLKGVKSAHLGLQLLLLRPAPFLESIAYEMYVPNIPTSDCVIWNRARCCHIHSNALPLRSFDYSRNIEFCLLSAFGVIWELVVVCSIIPIGILCHGRPYQCHASFYHYLHHY